MLSELQFSWCDPPHSDTECNSLAWQCGNILKIRKDVHDLCFSNSTSGSNSRKAKKYAHCCDERIIMEANETPGRSLNVQKKNAV